MRIMDQVNINDLRRFLAVSASQTTRSSATQLGVGQSAVSRGVTRLEAELGVELFTRSGRYLRLNRLGQIYRAHAQRAVAELDTGARRLRQESEGVSSLRIGFLHLTGGWLADRVLLTFGKLHPDIHIELREGTSAQVRNWLDNELIDVAVTTEPSRSDSRHWLLLLDSRLTVVVATQHRLTAHAELQPNHLHGESLAMLRPGTELREVVDRYLAGHSVEPAITLETNDSQALTSTVVAGLSATLLPHDAVQEPGLTTISLNPPCPWSLGLTWHGRPAPTSEVGLLLAHAQQLAAVS